ncbi:activating signal cointegrator 1 complex subunit 3-like [Eriocheir sinensis]|uniref:activating signal cointegrator 1 complex subunit 3-like n=1 Tax=Eriocheir sinensis TaxID=95602 RepID=UPI0021CA12A4|nr:activating signal cointegrator 1 complex subunit 3-like [Eriocheir sinensis]
MPPQWGTGEEDCPRLTTFLRTHANVSRRQEEDGYDLAHILATKRELRRRKALKSGVTWGRIKGQVERMGRSLSINLECYLREVWEVARQVAPELDTREEAAALLFTSSHPPGEAVPTLRSRAKLRRTLGDVHVHLLDRAHKAVRQIVDLLGQEEVTEAIKGLEESPQEATPMFGENIKIGLQGKPPDLIPPEKLLDLCKPKVVSRATLNFEDYQTPSTEPVCARKVPRREMYDRSWVEAQMLGYYSDTSIVAELSSGTHTLLMSSKGDDELQNELFDLLGFERFELIQTLLQHRQQIKNAPPDKEKKIAQLLSGIEGMDPQVGVVGGPQQKAVVGQQVTVMNETEKQLLKQARREERRLMRTAKQLEKDETADDFDPETLRAKRESALLQASQAFLFKKRERAAAPEVKFPYVFDMHGKAKESAGFIAGLKMALPEGFERSSDSTMEEVRIPTSDPAPPEVGGDFVPISEMDEIGRTVFRHCKTLNRIQTVVHPVAYHTNHNLLICAPTGAGKTNIALLTVVHQIRKHVEQGVIQMDKFKIVYIAPMKALAAEMARNFSKRLEPLGLKVRELTGDMHLTKPEIMATHMIITTPEKWDVTTRKPGDTQLAQLVKLLIIDEVHLLHGDRGPVLETLVARTLRMVESQQSMIRIVGLSATLPNYIDVATFLRVNPYEGLFYFDGRFRPVPLGLTFVGVKAMGRFKQLEEMDRITFDKCLHFLQQGHQVMVFVHARNGTLRTAENLIKLAQEHGKTQDFMPEPGPDVARARKDFARSRNKRLGELFDSGFGVHHAGLLRSDRNLVENYFSQGYIRVLVCTATLAWGVNLPAHAVIIKGTEIYDSKHGTMVDLGILDVLQIFGRAGRPQFDKTGHGTIITAHDKLAHYLSLLTNQYPIESSFINHLADNLNAEVALGTVTNIEEAVEWMSYTYLFVRMRKNPQVYGLQIKDAQHDPTLEVYRKMLLTKASRELDKARMVRFDEATGYLHITDMGRVASQFYIKYDTIEVFNEYLKAVMNEADILAVVSQSSEFTQLKVRDEEMNELDDLHNQCEVAAAGGAENVHGKVNILLQSHISRIRVEGFSLVSDANYVTENSVRITRALFEIVLHRGWPLMAGRLLTMAKMLELQMWHFESPLRQFHRLTQEVVDKIEDRRLTIEKIRDMDHREIGKMLRHERMGHEVKAAAWQFPFLNMEAVTQPITRTVLRVRLTITPEFTWNDKVHGGQENYWIWVEDPDTNHMYHHEQFTLTKKQVVRQVDTQLVFTIPIFEPMPTQYYIRAISDRWLNCESTCVVNFRNLILPERHPPHTDLLDLDPLPVTALNNSTLEMLYPFTHFNPIQTQLFHALYHTDHNVLLGAPTGSGKTIAAEIAMFRVFREYPESKVVYIAPMKALVRERVEDWRIRLQEKLNKKVVELTGDVTPDIRAIQAAHVIVTTPEKWDGISRSWQTRNYVKQVALIVIDEIHLLGEDRGPVLEVIVSRTNFISSHTGQTLRIIGLSTALANSKDLANWLGIGQVGLYNFRPSVRPVPLEVHISGFPGKHYCPRMATMNKPTFQAIKQYSPDKPVLVFVSSRRQTRLTAMDLMGFVVVEANPKQWLKLPEYEMEQIISRVKDDNLRLCLSFGVGLHHAGLVERDRRVVEELFVNQKIQVLITTATLAWGVNFPAHLVVVKGTEYYDGKTRRYVDFPITDVLQMMGRAGRPQFDNEGVAVILVHDQKKHFYKKFLYEPFPVESSLQGVLPDHLNAEIVAGTITTKQEALDYLTWTYFFRRLLQNPSYYGLELEEEAKPDEAINHLLSSTVDRALATLAEANCVGVGEDGRSIEATPLGRISSFYYISHKTIQLFHEKLKPDMTLEALMELMTEAHEYSELPVRHNEDLLNGDLAKSCPLEVSQYTLDSPHTKTFLLLQAHLSRLPLPCVDYLTDTKSVLDQSIRILQAMLDMCGCAGWLAAALQVQMVMQMVTQARWHTDAPFLTLPHITHDSLDAFRNHPTLPHLMEAVRGDRYEVLAAPLRNYLEEGQVEAVHRTLQHLPRVAVSVYVRGRRGHAHVNVNVALGGGRGDSGASTEVEVEAGQEYTLAVTLTRLNRAHDLRVHTQKFPKPKDEGWFLVLGEAESGDLVALRRVSGVRGRSTYQLSFKTPTNTGRSVLTLYLMSDGYLFLDQQYDIPLRVVPATRNHEEEEWMKEEEEEEEKKKGEEEESNKKWLPPPPDMLPVMKSCFSDNKKKEEEKEEEEEEEEAEVARSPSQAWGSREQRQRGGGGGRRRNR